MEEGVGSGIILNGNLFRGKTSFAGEIGYLQMGTVNEKPKNLLKAAYYYNLEYQQNEDERILDKFTDIFQTIVDNLEIEGGSLTFNSIIDYLGEDAADEIVDILIVLQNKFESEEYNAFIEELFKLEFWIKILSQTIDVE